MKLGRVLRGVAWLACIVVARRVPVCDAQSAITVRPLSYTRFVLPNGLVALVNEDHTSPIVALDVWYHVGAKDEGPGQAGFAHLCEHLMGEGSPNVAMPHRVFIQSLGGTSVRWASTTEDVTHYYYTVPRHQLEVGLWLESDRMAAPLTRADAAHLGVVREVMRQERAQGRENPVFGIADAMTLAGLFPEGHPYRADPVGPMTDLDAATPDAAKRFCAPYYVPSNAVIALSGDVSPDHVKTLIEKYFSDIPRGSAPAKRAVPAGAMVAPARLVLEDARAREATLRFAWPTVGFAHADRLPLAALASLLSRDRSGILSKLLVYDRSLATRVTAVNFDFEQGGLFQIDVSARPSASLTAIEQLVDSVLTSLTAATIREQDLENFKRSNAVDAVTRLQARAMRADTLAHGEIFAGDPVAYAKQVNQTFALTAADVHRVAQHYLTPRRVVMSMIPAGKLDLRSKADLPFTNVTPSAAKPQP